MILMLVPLEIHVISRVLYVGTPINCDDGNPCTTDSCDPVNGCTFTPNPNNSICDDGNVCTSGDVCYEGTSAPYLSLSGMYVDCYLFGQMMYDPCTIDYCDPMGGCVIYSN